MAALCVFCGRHRVSCHWADRRSDGRERPIEAWRVLWQPGNRTTDRAICDLSGLERDDEVDYLGMSG